MDRGGHHPPTPAPSLRQNPTCHVEPNLPDRTIPAYTVKGQLPYKSDKDGNAIALAKVPVPSFSVPDVGAQLFQAVSVL